MHHLKPCEKLGGRTGTGGAQLLDKCIAQGFIRGRIDGQFRPGFSLFLIFVPFFLFPFLLLDGLEAT